MDRTLNLLKNRTGDRVIFLKTQEGRNTLTDKGMVDNRLFTGENKLHAMLDKSSMLWSVKYEMGSTPATLQQRFTSFPKLLDYVTKYYARRNVDIKEIIDQ